jgi:hypothetical protein
MCCPFWSYSLHFIRKWQISKSCAFWFRLCWPLKGTRGHFEPPPPPVLAHHDSAFALESADKAGVYAAVSHMWQNGLTWYRWESYLISQVANSDAYIFVTKFHDSAHIFICYAYERTSWMLSIVARCNFTYILGKQSDVWIKFIVSSPKANFTILKAL